ncbi:MAG TPA: hypothetical protein HA362_08015 [Nanoarchaeota archaeon]|nr:hypothetical protein [Nanoarchaeota archaeon]
MYLLPEDVFNFLYAKCVLNPQNKSLKLGYRTIRTAAIYPGTEFILEECCIGEESTAEYLLTPVREVTTEGTRTRLIFQDGTEEEVAENGNVLRPAGIVERLERAAAVSSLAELLHNEPGLIKYLSPKDYAS